MSLARLGVNIDHVATLRQARGEYYPQIERAAEMALANGAEQITIHLREDYRHIQPSDIAKVKKVCQQFKKPLNLEMGCNQEIVDFCLQHTPEWICLVPEKRQERTTEGGLNLSDSSQFDRVQSCLAMIKKNPKIKVSLFLEASEEQLLPALDLNIDAVEIHTGRYAADFLKGHSIASYLENYQYWAKKIKQKSIGYHAGHGLTDQSLLALLELAIFEEYNIGHWIVCESLFRSLECVVSDLKKLMEQYPLVKF